MAKEIAEEYTSSLADLTLNSKPLINMLTMLADDNIEHAEAIVQAVEKHLEKVRSEYKLPVLYLIDSIVKNVGRAYTQLFTQNIVNTFCSVFEKVDEKVRAQMFKLRQTWNEVFPAKKLYTLDIRVQCIDPAWPITAPPPTPSIHVNPKFFNKPATPPAIVVPPATNPVAAVAAAAAVNLDPATLDMHTQLINKQKELLELKQKKIELELLQARAKLEEQQKQLQIHTQQIKPTTPGQNLLLKPEVSKQLSQAGGLLGLKPTEKSSKLNAQNTQVQSSRSSHQQQQQQQLATTVNNVTTSGTRIAPVNSAMIAASVRPGTVRDPRLLRQQPAGGVSGSGVAATHSASTVSQHSTQQITSNNFENVNIDDKKVKSKSNNTINIDCASDKTSLNNKSDNTLNRKDPRLLTNKAPGSSSLNKNKSSNGRPVSSERSPNKTKTSPSNNSQSRKSSTKSTSSSSSSSLSSSSRSFKSSGPVHKIQLDAVAAASCNEGSSVSSKSVKDSSTAAAAAATTSSSLTNNSNTNNKGSSESNKNSPSSSPNKYRKGKSEQHSDNNKSVEAQQQQQKQPRTKNSSNTSSSSSKSRSRDRSDKYDDESISPTNTSSSSAVQQSADQRTFKGLKGTTKNRNYMRRNRAVSISPEPSQDVDLRVCAPPEKQPRLHQSTDLPPPSQQQQQHQQSEEITKSTTLDDNSSVNKDVDLRTLVPLAINKKRSSTEKLEATNAKKSKSQMFDVLFGNEDVDLRQLPPVLSTQAAITTPSVVKRPPTPPPPIISTISEKAELKQKGKPAPADKAEWNAIRAKLAKATKKSSLDDIRNSEDTDMRKKSRIFGSNSGEKIIISKDDEQKIKEGNLSQALVEKVLTLFETQKLQEAQRRESEEFKTNVTLQPISDDELSVDFSHSDSDEEPKSSTRKADRDERVPPPAPVISCSKDQNISAEQQKDTKQNHIDTRALNPRVPQNVEHNWHHRRRKMIKSHWDSPPQQQQQQQQQQHHSTPEPWIRPPPAVLNQALYGQINRRPFQPFMRSPLDNFTARMETAVPPHVLETNRTSSPPTIGSQNTRELPPADPLVLEYIDKDTMRAINIDGRLREIRYYDETAIAIMSWDDPREITFQNGTRLVTFDDKESYMLSFNDVYKDVTIGGKAHRIRLGAPTRELYIDGKWYECFFGGPGIGIEIDGKICVVKLDGPPPHVKIGNVKRNDLVAGKISLIINARTMIPIFLDAKPQKFDIEGKLHTLRFVDALRTVLINELPFKVEFGGLPKPITVHDKKHFIRFSILPKGIKPGYVKIANMEGQRFPTPPRNDENSNDAIIVENISTAPVSVNEPALPMLGKRQKMRSNQGESSPDRNSPVLQNSSLQSLGSLDVLSSIMTSPNVMTSSTNVSGYQVEATQDSQDGFPVITKQNNEIPGLTTTEQQKPPAAAPPSIPFLAANFNINELFEILVTTGIITTETTQQKAPTKDDDSYIKPVLFSQPETLKVRQQNIITTLYSGMQCSSCGVRFPPEHSMQYSQHLDWHFRQNRRGRNSARKALCRKWYYEVSDWKNYEEIEDIEEREKNWFESQQQQQQAEGLGEDGEEEIEIPSVPADSNSQETCCEVCHDKFEQFYNEEKEEWHLRMAIRVDEKTYHPLCYDDYKASLLTDTLQHTLVSESEEIKENEAEAEAKSETKVEDEVPEKMEVDEEIKEEEIVVPEEEIIKTEETVENDADVKIDDDEVIIQEPKIEQIIIDDNLDDDYEEEDLKDIKTELFPTIKIKEEPMDDTDICITNIKTEPLDPEIEETVNSVIPADTTSAEILTSIDGNVQLNTDMPISVGNTIPGRIKINITKPILAPKEATTNTTTTDSEISAELMKDSNEPLPPGEEPVQLNLKPALQGLTLTKQSTVLKGNELTGLCSIM